MSAACPLCEGPTTDTRGRPNACGLGCCRLLSRRVDSTKKDICTDGDCPYVDGPRNPLCACARRPKALDAIVDVVLAYRPKPKSKPAKKRARRRNKAQK